MEILHENRKIYKGLPRYYSHGATREKTKKMEEAKVIKENKTTFYVIYADGTKAKQFNDKLLAEKFKQECDEEAGEMGQ